MRSVLLLICIISVAFYSNAQRPYNKTFEPGCYYMANNQKECGLLHWNAPMRDASKAYGDYVQFALNNKSTVKKIKITDLRGFVIGQDSFVISHITKLTNYPVLKVLLDKPVKLYESEIRESGLEGPAEEITYFYGASPEFANVLKPGDFERLMCNLMADRPEVVKKIKNKTYGYYDMEDLVYFYNTGTEKQK